MRHQAGHLPWPAGMIPVHAREVMMERAADDRNTTSPRHCPTVGNSEPEGSFGAMTIGRAVMGFRNTEWRDLRGHSGRDVLDCGTDPAVCGDLAAASFSKTAAGMQPEVSGGASI